MAKTPWQIQEALESELIKTLAEHNADKVMQLVNAHPELLKMDVNGSSLLGHIVYTGLEWLGDEEHNPANAERYNKMIFQLLEKNPPYYDHEGGNILHKLYLHNGTGEDFESVRQKTNADINSRNNKGETPLLRQMRVANMFVGHLAQHPEVDKSTADERGNTPLHGAAALLYADVIDALLHALPVNALNQDDETPLGKTVKAHRNTGADDTTQYPVVRQIVTTLMQHGGLVDPHNPSANVPVIKNIAMGYAVSSDKGPALFDKITWELKNLETKISRRIPKEQNSSEFRAFAEVIAKTNAFAKAYDPAHPAQISTLLTDAIERTDGSWQKVAESLKPFSEADCASMHDMVREFVQSVVLPEIAQRTKNRASLIDYPAIVDKLVSEIAPILIADRPLSTMLKISRTWHDRLGTLENARTVRRTGSWQKATDDFTASNGYVLTFLDTADKLKHEGDTLHHCVGGYTEKCKKGSHVASIRKPVKDGDNGYLAPVLTVEFTEQQNTAEPLRVKQRLGDYDKPPLVNSPEVQALKEFVEKTKTDYKGADKITIDFDKIKLRRSEITREGKADDVKNLVGYDPFASSAPDKQDQYFKLYLDINTESGRTGSFIPGGGSRWKDKNAEDFITETKIMDKILRIAKEPPLLAKQGVPWP